MIDAHQHFWQVSRADYGWLTPRLAPIYRDYGPRDLAPILERHGIDATILVQAAPTVAETRYLLEIAAAAPFVAGVVGWCEFDAPTATAEIRALATNDLLVGLRPMVHDLDDPTWLARPALAPAFEALVAHDLAFDALVRPVHLSPLLRVLERHPRLRVVVDHGAKPDIRAGAWSSWRDAMTDVAAFPQAVCKLSGLLNEAQPGASLDDLRRYIDTLIELFGADRVLWGSDWPVVELAGGYDRWRAIALTALAPFDEPARSGILGGNAARTYLARRGRAIADAAGRAA